ncbi:DNA ligase, partial [Candidatus Roizmanbacteria bacterium CG_4_10_14_3_um_filter_33_21]
MKFSQLAIYIQQIDKTQSRLEITRLLSELYLKLNKEEIDKTIYLMQGRVAPLFDPVEFGMAEKSVIKAAVSAMQIDPSLFKTKYQEIGDIGKTVEYFKNQYHSFEEMDLEIIVVFEQLQRLAKASGNGSQTLKQGILSLLIRQLNAVSCCYLVRIPLGILRLGFSDMTVLDALSWMLTGDKKLRGEIEHAYHVLPDLGMIGKIVKKDGIKGIKTIKPKLFTPIIMMRAERLSSGEEIIKQIGRCAIEPKYDGFRLQAHFDRKLNQVKLYSRNLEEVSLMFPDIVEGIKKQIHGDKIIIEGETVGFDPKTGKNLPFQETVQRKRKYDIAETAKTVPLKFF